MSETWTVGPPSPPAGPARRGAVWVVLALVAGFVGGLAAGFALDEDPGTDGVGVVADGLGRSELDAWTDDDSATFATATTFVASAPGVGEPDHSGGRTPRVRLFRRDSSRGDSVRVFSHDSGRPPSMPCSTGQWCPPPECFPSRYLEVDAVSEWTVSHGGAGDFPVREGEVVRVLGLIADWNNVDDTTFGVIARAADGVQSVRLGLGGVTDEMAPVEGLVVLVVPSTGFDPRTGVAVPTGAALEAVDAAGVVLPVPLVANDRPQLQCMPPPPGPPALPAPGEQPADPAAQDAAIRERFVYLFGPQNSAERLAEVVDDPAGLDELRVQLRDRHPDQVGNVEYEVGDLVFTSPEGAVYTFRPIVSGQPLPWQIGNATLVDGRWMITRGTVCAMYRLGGANC